MIHHPQREFRKRTIVHLTEGRLGPGTSKTTRGVIAYSPHDSVGIIDSTHVGKTAQQVLGTGGDIPVKAGLTEFLAHDTRPDTLVVGVSPVGGELPPEFRRHIIDALEAGIDVWSGMHQFVSDDHEFRVAAERGQADIWDVRKPPEYLPVAQGHMVDSKSYTVTMIGTDCALGKMTSGLEIRLAAMKEGISTEFVATGQTGMMIMGWGHPIDAIPGDFMAGCVEKDCLSVDGKCEMIVVEGQGSLYHPGYSPVTLGLLHGSMPDAMVLCHHPLRTHIASREWVEIPPLTEVAALYESMIRHFKPTKVVGVCLNTWGMEESAARRAVDAAAAQTGLPATDAVRFGSKPLLEAFAKHREEIGKAAAGKGG